MVWTILQILVICRRRCCQGLSWYCNHKWSVSTLSSEFKTNCLKKVKTNFFMKYEQAFNLKPNTEGVFDTEKSKEQVEILGSIHLSWLLQLFSAITDLFKCVSSFYGIFLILTIPEISSGTLKKVVKFLRGVFCSQILSQEDKQVKLPFYREILKKKKKKKKSSYPLLTLLIENIPSKTKNIPFQRECKLLQIWEINSHKQRDLKLFPCINYFMCICCVFFAFFPAAPGRGCYQTLENSRGVICESVWVYWHTDSSGWSNQPAHSIRLEITQDALLDSCQAADEVTTAVTTLHNYLTLKNKNQHPCCL